MKNFRLFLIFLLSVFLFSFIIHGQEKTVDEKITEVELSISSVKAKLAKINEKIESAEDEILKTREISPSPLIDEYKSEIIRLKSELKEKLLTYRQRHPVIKKLNARIEHYEHKLNEEAENTFEKKIYSKNPELLELVSRRNDLETELSGLSAVAESLASMKEKEIEVKQSEETGQVVIDPTTGHNVTKTIEPDDKMKKNIPYSKIFLSLLLIILVAILVYIVNYFRIHRKRPHGHKEDITVIGGLRRVKITDDSSDISEDVVIYNTPDTPIRSDLREALTSIERSGKTFCVSSEKKGTGKTFFSANTAAYYAMAGNKVLLIDSNFYSPRVHRIFLTDNDTGFSDILLGENVDNVIKSTPVTGLDIITAGHDPLTGSEILDSTSFLDFIKNMEERYDHIIIDSSSISQDDYALVAGKYYPVVSICSTNKEAASFEETAFEKNIVYSGAVIRDI